MHVTEPEYTYIRGQGWQIIDNLATTRDGVQVKIEFRDPILGEKYSWIAHEDPPDWETVEKWRTWIIENKWSYISEYDNPLDFERRRDAYKSFVTFVVVND